MKESTKSLIDIEVEYGVVSFKNKKHKPSPDFFEPSNVIIFPEPSMKPNYPSPDNYNINFRYFIIKSIHTAESDNVVKNRVVFNTTHMFDYISKHYDYQLGVNNEYKYTVSSFVINSSIPYSEIKAMMEDNNDLYKKNLIKKIYENTIDDLSAQPVEDVSIARLLRLYNEPNRENAVYNTDRCGFSVVLKINDESYLNRVINIFNKVDYGFIRSKIKKEDYIEIDIFIYSISKHKRELDIARVRQFIKNNLKCYEDSFEIMKFDVLNTEDEIYHKFNLTGHDNEALHLHGDNIGMLYFRVTDENKYNLAENVYEQVDEKENIVE